MEKQEKLQDLMRELFDREDLIITETTSPDDIEEWDSFSHIHLCAALEKAFNIKLTTEQAIGIHTVGDILAMI